MSEGSKYVEHLMRLADQCVARSEGSQEQDIRLYWVGRADSYISAASLAEYYGIGSVEEDKA